MKNESKYEFNIKCKDSQDKKIIKLLQKGKGTEMICKKMMRIAQPSFQLYWTLQKAELVPEFWGKIILNIYW